MKLLLDEMISFRIAADLRARGHDVVAVKRDRPDLESLEDRRIIEILADVEAALAEAAGVPRRRGGAAAKGQDSLL